METLKIHIFLTFALIKKNEKKSWAQVKVPNFLIKEYCKDLYFTLTGTTSTVVTTAGCSDQPRKFADMNCNNNGVGNMNSTSGIEMSILTYHCRYPQAEKDASNPQQPWRRTLPWRPRRSWGRGWRCGRGRNGGWPGTSCRARLFLCYRSTVYDISEF